MKEGPYHHGKMASQEKLQFHDKIVMIKYQTYSSTSSRIISTCRLFIAVYKLSDFWASLLVALLVLFHDDHLSNRYDDDDVCVVILLDLNLPWQVDKTSQTLAAPALPVLLLLLPSLSWWYQRSLRPLLAWTMS